MEDLWLLILYALMLIALIFIMHSARKGNTPSGWMRAFIYECVGLAVSLLLMLHFNSLPGYGMMPGLTYLGEVLFSLASAVVFSICIVISLITFLVKRKK